MKKKIIAAVTLAALLLAILGAALAAPGDSTDPFVTLSYLTNTFFPQAEKDILDQVQTATSDIEKAAFDKLDALTGSFKAQAGGGELSDTFWDMTLYRGDRLDLPTGASILFEGGICELVFASGTLIDVTDGKLLPSGSALTPGHRYMAAEDTACSITALSDSVYLSVRGRYVTELTGIPQTPFTDLVAAKDWFYPGVRFVCDRQLFNGVSTTQFGPSIKMSRGMVVTVLSRMHGFNGTAPSAGFTDVPADSWYTNAVNWSVTVGISSNSNGTFNPNADVTREQLCVMLYRYSAYLGLNMNTAADLSRFPDQNKVASYAVPAMTWAVANGIIGGTGDGTLNPAGTATRAEVSTILQRFCNLLG